MNDCKEWVKTASFDVLLHLSLPIESVAYAPHSAVTDVPLRLTRPSHFRDSRQRAVNRVAGLLQTAVLTAFVGKTVSILSEYDDILDVRELFEGRIDLSQDACISADAWRTGGTAQAQRASA